MAKIEAYKFINPGMATDNASEGSLVGRKLVLSFNHFGKTLNSIGSVVKDIENIEIARIKNDEFREKLERRQAQRDRDEEAEEAIERKRLEKSGDKNPNKSKIKGFFGKSKIGKGLMKMLPAWAQALQPIFSLIAEIFKIAVIKEMLEWWSDPENKEKIDTFFHKANVIFKKLREFSKWLFAEKLAGGWHKFTRGDTFKERIGGLGDLLMGVGIVVAILNPIATFGAALTGLGWLIKNLTGWLKDPFAFLRNKGKGGGKMPKNPSKKGSTKQQIKNKYQKYQLKKGIKPNQTTSNVNIKGTKVKVKGQTPLIPKPGQGVLKNKNVLKRTWDATKGWLGKNKKALSKVPGVSFVMKRANPLITGGLAVLELNERLNEGQSAEKAITSTAVGTAGAWTGFTVASGAAATKLSPLLLAPFPGARPLYAAGVLAAGIGGAWGGGQASKVSDAAFDAAEDKNEKSKWWNPLSWTNNNKPNVKVEQKTPVVEVPKKKKSSWSWSNLFGSSKKQDNKSSFVQPQPTVKQKKETQPKSTKKWWEFWKQSGGKLKEYGIGGFFKGIGKAVSGVVNGVSKAVGGVINSVSNIVSNPIVGTALSFIPGVGPIVGAINAFNSLKEGNIMGAIMSGVGALGQFSAIGSTAKSVVNTPNWMMNLRMSKFGQGLAGMYTSGANAWAGLTAGVNNFMGSKWGQLAQGVYTGATGGGWGGALSAGSNILGLNQPGSLFGEGGFFGEGGRMANFGNWLNENNLAGFGNMFPGLSGLANSIPGFANLPGIQDIFAGGFSPMQAIGGLAEKHGMGGLYKSAMGLLGGGDMFTGLKELAGEIGVSPEALGAVDKGKSLFDRAKGIALNKDPVELIPIVVPILQDQIVISPAVKEKAVVFHDMYNSFAGRL